MKDEIIICDCSSAEHQLVLRFDDDKDLGRQVFVEIHLVPLVWYKRLWLGIKYIFGYKCKYGNFEEMILPPKHARQVYDLYRFLNKSNVGKQPKPKFKRGNTITNGENHGVIVVDKTFDVDNSGRGLHWTYCCLEPNGNALVIDKKDEDKWELQTED